MFGFACVSECLCVFVVLIRSTAVSSDAVGDVDRLDALEEAKEKMRD